MSRQSFIRNSDKFSTRQRHPAVAESILAASAATGSRGPRAVFGSTHAAPVSSGNRSSSAIDPANQIAFRPCRFSPQCTADGCPPLLAAPGWRIGSAQGKCAARPSETASGYRKGEAMVTRRSSSRFGLLLVLCAFLLASLTHAQTVTGTITGTVVDSTGATLPGTTVTVTNEATGAERSTGHRRQRRVHFYKPAANHLFSES